MNPIKRSKLTKICALALAAVLAVSSTVYFTRDKAYAEAASSTANGTVTVSGTGTVKVKPDMAVISVGVVTEDRDAATAQNKNSQIMDKVLAAIKEMGISEERIKTSSFYMYPNYNYADGKNEISGYSVTHMLSVTIKDIDNVGKYLDKAIESGANASSSISFSISNAEEYYAQALVKAVANAKSKADVIAGAMGVTLTNPIQINESGTFYTPASNYNASYSGGGMREGAADMAIATGELEISASISATYQY